MASSSQFFFADLPCTYCEKEMNVEPRCHVHVLLNDASGTISATLFSSTAENFIGYTAFQLMEADEHNSPLTNAIATKIDKKPVFCFLKDYDRSFESKFEKTFTIVKLYAKEEIASGKQHEHSSLLPDEGASNQEVCATAAAEKEKQMFSPSTKSVVDEIADEVGVDVGMMVPPAL